MPTLLLLLKIASALSPALLLLLLLDRMEAFNLIRLRHILAMLATGAAIAVFAYYANTSLIARLDLDFTAYSRFVSPPVEEALKAVPIVALFALNRIGFKIDAAIVGFAIGTGFSIVENAYYLWLFSGDELGLWLLRGLGTAMMHGGATALFAVIAHELTDEQAIAKASHYRFSPWLFLPGLIAATLMHGGFNLFLDQPLLLMLLTFILVPLSLFAILSIGEAHARTWISNDNLVHRQMLDDLASGHFEASPTGQAICAIADHFNAGVRHEVFDYVTLHTELVLRAERSLIERADSGADVVPGLEERDRFDRLRTLEQKIGKAGLRALRPHLHFSRNDLWEMRLLAISVRGARRVRPRRRAVRTFWRK